MANFLDNYTNTAGETIGNHTSDSGHDYEANTAIVFSNANSIYINNVAGSMTSQINGFVTDAAYEMTLTIRRLDATGNVGVFIGDTPLQNGYLFLATVSGGSNMFRVFKYVGGVYHGIIGGYMTSGLSMTLRVTPTDLDIVESGTVRFSIEDTTFTRAGKNLFLRLGVVGSNTTGYHIDKLEVEELILPVAVPLVLGSYTVAAEFTAPDLSTDTGTGTLQVVDKLPVNNSRSISWNCTSSVLNSSEIIWTALEHSTGQVQLSWSFLSSISSSLSVLWSAKNQTDKGIIINWGILQTCLSQLSVNWDSVSSAEQTAQLHWSLLQSATNAADLQWSLIELVNSSTQLDWQLLASLENVSGYTRIDWSLLANVDRSIQIDWSLLSTLDGVSNSFQAVWGLAGKISSQLEAQWNVLNAVGVSKDLQWDLSVAVAKEIQANWDLLQGATNGAQLIWDSAGTTSQGIQLNWTLQTDSVRVPLHVMVIKKTNRIMKILH